jgi:hypothetical protein
LRPGAGRDLLLASGLLYLLDSREPVQVRSSVAAPASVGGGDYAPADGGTWRAGTRVAMIVLLSDLTIATT